ncbi:geranylgeranyl reductase family protein [Mastigocoleus sp. MO_188.B34]|uniref:geranylgeranyl reductase family protein n=1 Tax=Mastigocoleus sp. MO_188.B34 TaxID=3036635 RepID=UPI0026361479|nr:geranylgeranyl reductase family protein [Mastigocoleus sp. MO_188.B34]MDJ0695332.1 geranylgeranyl reductase family protein [Mastigocoleus sp. MO_188.B34]
MYDCIIVGAGPAGGTAAYHLAKRGNSVLVVEKESLPRYKPCGGGVSPMIAQWFDFDFSPAISSKANTIRCTWNMGDPVEAELKTPEPVWMVRRDIFDHFLVKQAEKQGAELRDNTKATGIEFKGDHWQVNTVNGSFNGRYLIAADGTSGPTAKWLGFKERKRCLVGALETEAAADVENANIAHFEFGMVKNGYLWNFPKADGYSIGIGSFLGGKSQNFKKILQEYGDKFGLDVQTYKQYGYGISLWNGTQKLHTERAVLAGEAACVVDPFTAEGIRPSIFSGLKAAEAIHKAITGDTNALEEYSNIINEQWGTDMAWAQKLANVFYHFPGIGYKVGVKRPSAPQVMGKILCGELRYSDVVGRALKRLNPIFG